MRKFAVVKDEFLNEDDSNSDMVLQGVSTDTLTIDELIGQVMVYRTYENVSLAIIMNAKDSVSVGYKALQP